VRRLLPVLVAAALAAATPRAQSGGASAWWLHVRTLADDAMRGRDAGSPEHRKAAEYVADQFKQAGLRPGMGLSGYLQPVPLQAVTIDRAASKIALFSGSRETVLDITKDVVVNGRGTCSSFEAPMTFIGYGLSVPELDYDDLAGMDLEGKVAVFFASAPSTVSGAVVAHRQGGGERWRVLRSRGAVGYVTIFNPNQPGANWQRTVESATEPTNALAGVEEFADRQIAATVSTDAAGALFEGSGRELSHLLGLLKERAVLPRFPLKTSIRASLRCTSTPTPSENVVGLLEGSDLRFRSEVVVLSAHLDHLGESSDGEDRIFNGAMDNAAGVASLIDVAARLRAANVRPRRTVAFVAVTAEEGGLLGSHYFVTRPPFPPGARAVANINLDMFLPIIPIKSLIAFGMEESSLQRDVEAAAASVGIPAERDPVPGQNIFIRSDQYNFVRAGVPSVMLLTGANGDRELWKTWETWMTTHYHRPSDDLKQPVNLESAETFQRALLHLVQRVADAETAPAWNPASVFRPGTN
jgi:Zn-dependent M28 family amino/carboxypeptidase